MTTISSYHHGLYPNLTYGHPILLATGWYPKFTYGHHILLATVRYPNLATLATGWYSTLTYGRPILLPSWLVSKPDLWPPYPPSHWLVSKPDLWPPYPLSGKMLPLLFSCDKQLKKWVRPSVSPSVTLFSIMLYKTKCS